jgi:ribosome-associated toxin RatA of RatAB toxin-antitoxin module
MEQQISVHRVIAAPASALFAIVSNCNRHPEIDGSGTVVKTKAGTPEQLKLGSKFGMSMKMGIPYSMMNTVIDFEQDKRIAWQTTLSGPLGRLIGGRIWRYQFDESDGQTTVTETWDISQDKQKFMMGPAAKHTGEAMDKTLERLAQITEG